MNRIRLLLVMHELTPTGAPRLALSTFTALRDDLDIRVVADLGGPLAEGFRALAPLVVLREGPIVRTVQRVAGEGQVLATATRLNRRVRTWLTLTGSGGWRPDVTYVNTVAGLPVLAQMRWVRRHGAPIVLHVHEGSVALGMYEEMWPGLIGSMPDRYVAVSTIVAGVLTERFNVPPERISVVPPHVDDRWLIDAAPVAADTSLAESSRPIVVGGAGIPSWTKGVELWLLAAAELVRRDAAGGYRFVWVGLRDDVAGRQFRAMVTKLGLDGVVNLVPVLADPSRVYQGMDVFVVSSWEESASLVALELMALGKPVVCFGGSGGPVEEVGQVGIVVPDFSPTDMADAIQRLGSSSELRAGLGSAGRARVHDQFTAEHQVPRVLEQIRSAMAGAKDLHGPETRIPR